MRTGRRPAPNGLPEFAGDGIVVAGGARAILYQVAYPPVAHGVLRHSDFDERPVDRLWSTLAYAYAVVYGTDAQRSAAVRSVNRAHSVVRGAGSGALPAYNAYDPQLQLWVAATLYDTTVTVHERVFGALDEPAADRLYAAYAGLGTSLQLPLDAWPADRAAFDAYWAGMTRRLQVGPEVRALARRILFPRTLPVHLRPVMPTARLVTAGLLSPDLRAQYGVRWTPRAERRLDRLFSVSAIAWPLLPRAARQWPRDRALRSLDRAAGTPG